MQRRVDWKMSESVFRVHKIFKSFSAINVCYITSRHVSAMREINLWLSTKTKKLDTVILIAYVEWIFHYFIRIHRTRLFLAYFPATLCCRAFAHLRECFNYWRGSWRWNFIRAHILFLCIFRFAPTQCLTHFYSIAVQAMARGYVRPNESYDDILDLRTYILPQVAR